MTQSLVEGMRGGSRKRRGENDQNTLYKILKELIFKKLNKNLKLKIKSSLTILLWLTLNSL